VIAGLTDSLNSYCNIHTRKYKCDIGIQAKSDEGITETE